MKKGLRICFRICLSGMLVAGGYIIDKNPDVSIPFPLRKSQLIGDDEKKSSFCSGETTEVRDLILTGARVTITPQNKHAIVVKTEDTLLYRNDIYGFQILFDKLRGSPITIQQEDNPLEKKVSIYVKYQGDYDTSLDIDIRTYGGSEQYFSGFEDGDVRKDEIKRSMLGKNNKYVFTYAPGVPVDIMFHYFPLMQKHCTWDVNYKERDCGIWTRDILFTGFSTFDI